MALKRPREEHPLPTLNPTSSTNDLPWHQINWTTFNWDLLTHETLPNMVNWQGANMNSIWWLVPKHQQTERLERVFSMISLLNEVSRESLLHFPFHFHATHSSSSVFPFAGQTVDKPSTKRSRRALRASNTKVRVQIDDLGPEPVYDPVLDRGPNDRLRISTTVKRIQADNTAKKEKEEAKMKASASWSPSVKKGSPVSLTLAYRKPRPTHRDLTCIQTAQKITVPDRTGPDSISSPNSLSSLSSSSSDGNSSTVSEWNEHDGGHIDNDSDDDDDNEEEETRMLDRILPELELTEEGVAQARAVATCSYHSRQ